MDGRCIVEEHGRAWCTRQPCPALRGLLLAIKIRLLKQPIIYMGLVTCDSRIQKLASTERIELRVMIVYMIIFDRIIHSMSVLGRAVAISKGYWACWLPELGLKNIVT